MKAIKNLETLADTILEAQKADQPVSLWNMNRRLSENGGTTHGLWIQFKTDLENVYTVTLNKKKHLMLFRTFSAYEDFFDQTPAIHPTKGKPISYTFAWSRPANKAAMEEVSKPEEMETAEHWEQIPSKQSILATCPHSGMTQTIPPRHLQLILAKHPDLDVRIVTA